jgi:uncharacterized protein
VKASKLCNLRCRYCYEWAELGNTARLSLDGWTRLLGVIRQYHERHAGELNPRFQTCIVWHGGEPMLLPLAYFEQVMELQHRILGTRALRRGDYINALQTNAYTLDDRKLDLLQRERFHIGVSMDVVGGVRLSARGTPTEDVVVANMDRLRRRGIPFGAIVVLARHTCSDIVAIYDFYETIGTSLRVLPLFDAPLNTPQAPFHATSAEMAAALCRLFDHWAPRRHRISVAPLNDYARTVYLRIVGGRQLPYDRRRGEWAWLVNTDGTLYQVRDAYQASRALGNIFTDSLDGVLGSVVYRDSLDRDEALFERHCGPCRYRGACNSLPLFESPREGPHPERCHIAHDVIRHIETFVHANRYTAERIRSLLV